LSAAILVYGSQEFGRVVRRLVEDCGRTFHGFVDDWHTGDDVIGRFDSVIQTCPPDRFEFVIAVGYKNLSARWSVYQRVMNAGYRVATLAHPSAYVARSASIFEGALVMAAATVDVAATLRELVVLWPGAVISHDSEIGENCFVSPNATVCGHCRVGRDSFIGAGAVIVDHVKVPGGAFVKAGSVFAGGEVRRFGGEQ